MGKIMHGNQVYSGGGGSVVEANPSDTAGTNLTKIKIDGSTYAIPQGSGGGAVDDVQVDNVSVVDQNGIAHIDTMTGAGSSSAGTKGLVPAPASGDNEKFLAGDGTWKNVQGGGQGNILSGTSEPTSAIGSDGDVYYQYEENSEGWTADSEYLIENANTVFATDGSRVYTKINNGKAIMVYLSGSWSGGMLVSQEPLACHYSVAQGSNTSTNSTEIDGVTWYCSASSYWVSGVKTNTNGVAPNLTYDYSTQTPSDASLIIPHILQAANAHSESVSESIVAVYFKQNGVWIKDETGGGAGGYSETLLFEGTYQTTNGEITLSDNIGNYDQICIWCRWSQTSTNGEVPFTFGARRFLDNFPYDSGATAQTSRHVVLCIYDNQYIRMKCGSSQNKLFFYDSRYTAIARVVGIKYN